MDEHIPTEQQFAQSQFTSGRIQTSDETPAVGSILLGRYQIFGKKSGGMGTVLFVEDIFSGVKHAIKTLGVSQSPETVSADHEFAEEVKRILSFPTHPHVVQIHTVEIISSKPYLFMEYVPSSVRDHIGKLTHNEAVTIAGQICRAMVFIAEQRIIHADLKPENVLLTPEKIAKVTDFGISQLIDPSRGLIPRQLSGTPRYMPPEQLYGEIVDERSDIFSFGMILFEMLEGRLPYPFQLLVEPCAEREKLHQFYKGVSKGFSSDDSRDSPWANEYHNTQGKLKDVIAGCIMLSRNHRWGSFAEVQAYLDIASGEIVSTRELQSAIHSPARTTPTDGEADSLYHRALGLQRMGNLREALRLYNLALVHDPNKAEIWRDAGIALIEAGRQETGKRFIEKAIALSSDIEIETSTLTDI